MPGLFSGSYRISGIFSDKQAAFTSRPFTTLTLSADAPIIRGIRKQDWVGLGVEIDVIGNSGLFVGKTTPPRERYPLGLHKSGHL
ncbi:MAG: hypothetical protein IPP49_13170 [Saprospiraceae bacterium]|nr:hypothetical protein [Saprospiraceae bacterium]